LGKSNILAAKDPGQALYFISERRKHFRFTAALKFIPMMLPAKTTIFGTSEFGF